MLPLLVNWTEEDRAAKGLRVAPAAPVPPVHLTALELAAEAPVLLLLAPPGGGKSATLAHVARLAAGALASPLAVPRNAQGAARPEAWPLPPLPTHLRQARGQSSLAALFGLVAGPALLLLDDAEALGEAGPAALEEAAAWHAADPALRFLLAGDAAICAAWALPRGVRRHHLLPRLSGALPAAEALAQRLGGTGSPTALADRWRAAHVAPEAELALRDALREGEPLPEAPYLRHLLTAWALAEEAPAGIAARHRAAPERLAPVLPHLAARLREAGRSALPLAEALLAAGAALPAAELAEAAPPDLRARLAAALRAAIEGDALSLPARFAAGRHLARLGDSRDLEALVAVPAGRLAMGSLRHVNSSPPHGVALEGYRIGRYPVTNRAFLRFAMATDLGWRAATSLDGSADSLPATDVTWHEARAFCAWIAGQWRAEGRIGAQEHVRLPSEPEWEWAARGEQPATADQEVYPWAGPWDAARANAESAGLNAPCAVGLFPAGASPFGAEDLAGQVWEWTSTLWGEAMARPHFAYPYDATDGREAPAAGPAQRRVLRGGCFSSGPEKANCTYRGSLEPGGFWRGNGFRVVVAPVG